MAAGRERRTAVRAPLRMRGGSLNPKPVQMSLRPPRFACAGQPSGANHAPAAQLRMGGGVQTPPPFERRAALCCEIGAHKLQSLRFNEVVTEPTP